MFSLMKHMRRTQEAITTNVSQANQSISEINNELKEKEKENEEKFREINEANYENTPEFSLNGSLKHAKVVKVYDGDTIHVVFQHFDRLFRWNCRICNIDTPELRTKNNHEKQLGYIVRDKLIKMLQDKMVTVKCYDFDKYGRLLIDVYMPDEYKDHDYQLLSEWMVEHHMAFQYDGGTKKKWTTEESIKQLFMIEFPNVQLSETDNMIYDEPQNIYLITDTSNNQYIYDVRNDNEDEQINKWSCYTFTK